MFYNAVVGSDVVQPTWELPPAAANLLCAHLLTCAQVGHQTAAAWFSRDWAMLGVGYTQVVVTTCVPIQWHLQGALQKILIPQVYLHPDMCDASLLRDLIVQLLYYCLLTVLKIDFLQTQTQQSSLAILAWRVSLCPSFLRNCFPIQMESFGANVLYGSWEELHL